MTVGKGFALMVWCVALTGCGAEPSRQQSEYLTRLARVLDAPLAEAVPFVVSPFPGRRGLLLEAQAPKLDWVDFARLHRCDMGDLAGYRNSGLGRLMDAMGRLDYELSWMQAAQRCLNTTAGRETGSDKQPNSATLLIDTLIAQKRALLPAVFWNAVFANEAVQSWQGQGAAASADESAATAATATHVIELHDQVALLTSATVDVSKLERALQGLANGRRVGTAQRQWAEARSLLGRASTLLNNYGNTVCRNGSQTPQAKRLKAVFLKFYVAQEQPQLASLVREDTAWVTAFVALTESVGVAPPVPFQQWLDDVLNPANPQSQWQRTRTAFVAHSKAWQSLADQCGLDLFR